MLADVNWRKTKNMKACLALMMCFVGQASATFKQDDVVELPKSAFLPSDERGTLTQAYRLIQNGIQGAKVSNDYLNTFFDETRRGTIKQIGSAKTFNLYLVQLHDRGDGMQTQPELWFDARFFTKVSGMPKQWGVAPAARRSATKSTTSWPNLASQKKKDPPAVEESFDAISNQLYVAPGRRLQAQINRKEKLGLLNASVLPTKADRDFADRRAHAERMKNRIATSVTKRNGGDGRKGLEIALQENWMKVRNGKMQNTMKQGKVVRSPPRPRRI